MKTILFRIQQIAINEDITIGTLERKIGASKGVLSRAITNSTDIQSKWIQIIAENYPTYSSEWLLTGKGDMLKSDMQSKDIINKHIQDVETRPRIPLNAAAGSLSVCLDGITINHCEQMPVIGAFTRYDFTIMVRGESMEPYYLSGDELAGMYIKNTSFIQWGRSHILDTAQGIIIKNIYDNDDAIICKSENPRFPDFSIPKSEVYNIALVIGLIRRY